MVEPRETSSPQDCKDNRGDDEDWGPENLQEIEPLGFGSNSRVFLCQRGIVSDAEGVPVLSAVKKFSKVDIRRKDASRRRMIKESSLAARLCGHPLVVGHLGSFSDAHPNGFHYICLEYCGGGNLRRLLRDTRTVMSEADALFYAAQLLVAIEWLHLNGVVHRDIKPENVLLSSHGHVRLADFDLCLEIDEAGRTPVKGVRIGRKRGLSQKVRRISGHGNPQRRRSGGEEDTKRSQDEVVSELRSKLSGFAVSTRIKVKGKNIDIQEVVGTLQYSSPEVLKKNTNAIHRSAGACDFWSFGAVLFEIVVGRSLWEGEREREQPSNSGMDGAGNLKERPHEGNAVRSMKSTPFSREKITASIKSRTAVNIPSHNADGRPLSAPIRHLLAALLTKDPKKRLGFRYGASEVRAHPWFRLAGRREGEGHGDGREGRAATELVRTMTPPFIPELNAMDDMRYARNLNGMGRFDDGYHIWEDHEGLLRTRSCDDGWAAGRGDQGGEEPEKQKAFDLRKANITARRYGAE